MRDKNKTKEQLIQELDELRQKITELETEYERAMTAQRKSEAETEVILNALPDLMFLLSRDGTQLRFYAPLGDHSFWLSGDFHNKRIDEILPANTAAKYNDHIQKTLDTGQEQIFEYYLDSQQGERSHYKAKMVVAERDKVVVIVRNITERIRVERKLQEMASAAQSIITAMPDMLFRLSRDGIHLDFYAPNQALLFAQPERFLGKRVEEVLPDDVAKRYRHYIIQTLTTKEIQIFEYALDIPEQGYQVYEARMVVSGKNEVLTIVRNITERKNSREVLRREKERAQKYLYVAEAIIVAINPDEEITLINQKGCQILGYAERELLGENWFDTCIPKRHRAEMRTYFQKSLSDDIRFDSRYENLILTKSGQERIIEWHNTVIRDELGNITETMSSGQDITERRGAEETLWESEERYRTLFDNVPIGIGLSIPDQKVLMMNSALKQQFGYSEEELSQIASQSTYQNPDDRDRLFEQLKRDGSVKDFEAVFKRKDDTAYYVSMTMVPVPSLGEGVFMTMAIDITERRQAEQELLFHRRFENLITTLSTQFINVPTDQLDDAINLVLKQIGEFIGADRSYINLYSEDLMHYKTSYEWCAEGIEHRIDKAQWDSRDPFSWFVDHIKQLQVIHIPRVSDLPDEARAEREGFQANGVQSVTVVPLISRERSIGSLGFQAIRSEKTWSDNTVTLLQIVGEIYINALERKQAEAAMHESEERYRLLAENSPSGMFISDLRRFIYVNQRLCEICGYSEEEFLNMTDPIQTLFAPSEWGRIQAYSQSRIKGESVPTDYDSQGIRKNGESIYLKLFVSSIMLAGQLRLQGLTLDITEQKQTDQKLRDSEQRYRAVFEQGPLSITLADENGKLVAANNAMCEMLGYSEEELIALSFHGITHPDDRAEGKRLSDEVLQGELSFYKTEKRYVTKTKDILWATLTVSVIRDEKEAILYDIGMTEDITARRQAEMRLRESEARFKGIFENSPIAIARANIQGYLVVSNPAFSQLFGYSADELASMGFIGFVHPDDLDAEGQFFQELITGKRDSYQLEERLYHKNGDIIWCDVHVVLIRDDEGEPQHAIGIIQNITERKQAEEALRDSEVRYRAIVEDQTQLIGRWLLEGGIHTFVNRAYCLHFGMSEKELIGNSIFDMALPEDRDANREKILANIRALTPDNPISTDEYRGYASDGEIHWYQWQDSALFDKEGQIIEIQSVGEDITDRKRAEEALRESEERFRKVFQTSPVAMTITKLATGEFIDVNSAFEQIFGYSREETIGKSALDLNIWKDVRDREQLIPEYLKTGSVEAQELELTRKSGETAVTNVNSTLIDLNGEDYSIGIITDITERKQAEQVLQQSRERLRLLANRLAETEEIERRRLARDLHDQVGPNLTALGINLNIAKSHLIKENPTEVRARLEDALDMIESTTAHIRDVMNDLRPSILDDYGLTAALRWYTQQFGKRVGIEMTIVGTEIATRLPMNIENSLFRITQEALTNIAKHAQAKNVTLTIKEYNGKVHLTISDDGVGFSPISPTHADKHRGWGLFTMTERAEAIGAYCQIESSLNKGTTVSVEVTR